MDIIPYESYRQVMEKVEALKPIQLCYEDLQGCAGHVVVVDTETTGLFWYLNYMIGASIYCPATGFLGYIPTYEDREWNGVRGLIAGWPKETTVIFHNAKFDLHFLGINPKSVAWNCLDTSVMIHLYDSRMPKALEKAERILLRTDTKRDHIDEAPKKTKIWNWPLQLIAKYAVNDVVVTHQVAQRLLPELKDLGLIKVLLKEMEYMKELWETERYGFRIDDEYLTRSEKAQEITLAELETQLYDAVGYEFNWRSTKQLSHAIYENLGISKPVNPFLSADGIDHSRFADSGLYKSTCTATFLLTEKAKHPLGTLVAAVRESYRMLVTMRKYQELADSDRRVHQTYNQNRTRTGRLSCTKPNMQNVPSQVRGRFTQSVYSGSTIRTEEYNLRRGFIASPDKSLLSIDWKQMEMRMFGLLAKDELMMSFLRSGRDVHGEVANAVWGVVDKTHREWSKTIGFGLIYGMTLGSLMHKLNMTFQEAGKVRDDYLASFPRIMPFMQEVIDFCKAFEYVRYWDGRIWREENPRDMYKGANALIQGGCAEILSVAALRVGKWCAQQGSDFKMVNYVHDEIMLEIPDSEVQRSAYELAKIMEVEDLFGLPFYTDAKVGKSYGTQEKILQTSELGITSPEAILPTTVEHESADFTMLPDEPDNPFEEEMEEEEEEDFYAR